MSPSNKKPESNANDNSNFNKAINNLLTVIRNENISVPNSLISELQRLVNSQENKVQEFISEDTRPKRPKL